MIPLPFLASKTVAVVGLGATGMAAARALAAGGAEVRAWDDDAARRAAAAAEGIAVVDLATADLDGLDFAVWSPGIPHRHPAPHPLAARLRAAGVRLLCDIDLLAWAEPDARFIGITGTNGKSTTTALLAHMLDEGGRRVQAGGNLGTPALALEPLGPDGVYVLELSSYQLELLRDLRLDVAVLLNITPDHLDRHGGLEGYVAVKRRILDLLKPNGHAVIAVDDDHTRALAAATDARVVPVSGDDAEAARVAAADGLLIDRLDHDGAVRALDLGTVPALPGAHNRQNAAAAYAAARLSGLNLSQAAAGIASYPGLPHRQERIAVIDGVAFVNDSKATNADAAEKAIVCYDRIYWIAGGRAKEGGIGGLRPHFHRIRHAFLIGEAAADFAHTLGDAVPHTLSGSLDEAVPAARAMALADNGDGAVVLLSPACASFDQFPSFAARGDAFRRLVEALPGERRAAP